MGSAVPYSHRRGVVTCDEPWDRAMRDLDRGAPAELGVDDRVHTGHAAATELTLEPEATSKHLPRRGDVDRMRLEE